MPTIDQLAPATAAGDNDALLVSQGGTTRKITRAQVLAGVQPQLAVPNGSLVGRSSAGTGVPEVIGVGANLNLSDGTLSATASPFVVANLPAGTVPSKADLVPVGQSGTNMMVTYAQFMSGLSSVTNVDVSQMIITPAGASATVKLADFAASTLPISGGTLTGPLVLAADPVAPMEPASKGYVDAQASSSLSLSGGTLTGALILAGDPASGAQASTKSYVDTALATALPKSGGTLTGPLGLPADPTAALQAATKQYVDRRVSRTGDTLTGALTLAADPVAPLQAATKGYVDNQLVAYLPKSGGTLTGPLTLGADPSLATHAASKKYVDTQVATSLPVTGGSLAGPLTLNADPAAALQAATKQYVDGKAAAAVPLNGGTMTGSLTLAGGPTNPLHAATKAYVDSSSGATGVINVKSPPYNAKLDGVTDDTAAFKAAYQAAPAGSVIYVPNGVTVLKDPGTWGVALTKRVKWAVDGTKLPDGTYLASAVATNGGPGRLVLPGVVAGNSGTGVETSQAGSQPDDFAVAHSSYIVNHAGGATGSVSSNSRSDTIIYNSPNNYIWGGLDRLIWAGTQTPSGTTPAQHVGRYVQTIRQVTTTDANGKPLPQPQLWAACLEFRDASGKPSSVTDASLTVEMDWFGNGADDANNRQIQSLVVGQHDPSGSPVEVSSVIGVYLAAGSSGRAYRVFNVGIPFSTSILDTTASQQLPGAAAIRMAAGHAIAFEPTNSNRLYYDAASGTLRWAQGTLSYVVGKGISVGWQTVCAGNTVLANYLAGNIVFLVGGGAYTITLPAATTVAPGTGFTFSALGAGTVTIGLTGSDVIDNGPIVLRQNDRYHVVSDGWQAWREIFRTNAVNPRFSGTPVLPSYAVSGLPAAPGAGAKAFAYNGRKPNEGAGAGSGVEVFFDGTRWISVCSGTQVQA
jgi:hypothetical protein